MSDLSPSHKFDFKKNATPQEAPPPPNSSHEAPTQDASWENPPPSLDLESMSNDDKDLGYVEIDDFVQLQNCFDALSKSHDTLNQNVTMLTELLTNFIKINSPQDEGHARHAQGPPRAFGHAGMSSVVPPPHAFSTHAAPQPHAPFAHANALPHSSPIHAHGMQGIQDTHMVSPAEPTKEIVEVLKNLKPPVFQGEDTKRNKDKK